jgi:hypothetical protein
LVVDVAERVAGDVALEAGQGLEQVAAAAQHLALRHHDLLQAEEVGAHLAHPPAVGRLGPLEGE